MTSPCCILPYYKYIFSNGKINQKYYQSLVDTHTVGFNEDFVDKYQKNPCKCECHVAGNKNIIH